MRYVIHYKISDGKPSAAPLECDTDKGGVVETSGSGLRFKPNDGDELRQRDAAEGFALESMQLPWWRVLEIQRWLPSEVVAKREAEPRWPL